MYLILPIKPICLVFLVFLLFYQNKCFNFTEISKGYDHVDHIMPITKGGMSVTENMILVCEGCNLEKSYLSHMNQT